MDINEKTNIYESIAERTQGNIYLGVVGPVRSGKSTFIKRFMDLLVMPNLTNAYVKQRITDEMPQSGAGKTIMTAEPKFVPAEAVAVTLPGNVNMKLRMVDCVGYIVPGVIGHMEDGKMRMVATPWQEEKMPFTEAAELGTRKVIRDHSTIGIVVTTDGSIGDLPREGYEGAEERTVNELKEIGKPFVVVLNTTQPESELTKGLADDMRARYGVPVIPTDCAHMNVSALNNILGEALNQFPVSQINFYLPGFTEGLSEEHWIKASIISAMQEWAGNFSSIDDVKRSIATLADGEIVESVEVENIDLATGNIDVNVNMVQGLFYKVVEELMEHEVKNDSQFFSLLREFASAKKAYDKLESAMQQVEETGYGIVQPRLSEMILEQPEIFKQGSKYGVRLKAKAPSMHIIRTDITTEVSPIVGTEKQSEDLINHLITEFEQEPDRIWETNLFGKSLYEMVEEQMENKLTSVPDGIRVKVQKSLQKISDEGKDYFICIII